LKENNFNLDRTIHLIRLGEKANLQSAKIHGMTRLLQIILLIPLISSSICYTQSDTNLLYIDLLEINFADSSEQLLKLEFRNESDTILFTDVSKCRMIGINKTKTCELLVKTTKSEFILQDINEYISFIETKYRISIYLPINHSNCLNAMYQQPDGLGLFHSQTVVQSKNNSNLTDCIEVVAGPTGYAQFEQFDHNYLLK